MKRVSGFFAVAILMLAITLGITISASAFAQNVATPPANNTATAATTPTCALDEFPSTENGTTTCKKVPACKTKGEIISYDNTTQKFTCKKLIECDPKKQQAAYVNGKNVCIDIPNCEARGLTYAFDGTKMICK